jgi:hypothetical protein
MKAAVLAMICCAMASGQDSSANRAIPTTPAPHDGLAVRLLRPFEPETGVYRPPSAKVRFHEYVIATIGPFTIFREAAAAAIGQARNSPPEWQGGMEGYAKRLGNDLAKNAVRNTLAFGLSAALHEDNRYFASGKSGAARRVLHAALSPLETHRSDGRVGFSYSNAGGMLGASLISRTWAPDSWRHPSSVGNDFAFSFASQAAINIFREFVPDILHRR